MDRGCVGLSRILIRNRVLSGKVKQTVLHHRHLLCSSVTSTQASNLFDQSYSGQFRTYYHIPSHSGPILVRLNVQYVPHLSENSVDDRLSQGISIRAFHSSALLLNEAKPSSKIEETVIRLRKEQKEKQDSDKKEKVTQEADEVGPTPQKPRSEPVQDSEPKGKEAEEETKKVVPVEKKKSLWTRFVDEVKHYYSGFRLLFLDVKICSKIIWKVLQGGDLTRRESRQLVRTVSDLFRLVPFSVFIIVPFMELLLPVALKLFPGMLPSTFATTSEREAKMKRTLKAKLEYAKFLQKTLDEMAPSSSKDRSSQSAKDFVHFYQQVKENRLIVKNKDILKFSQLFKDEITLNNMTRQQLIALCKLLELTPIGTNNFLQFQLEMKLKQLRNDDRAIQREGVENMNVEELQAACKERGMRALGLSEEQLQRQLGQWLDLSLNENVPSSLLLLSRTLYLPEDLAPTEQIAATISALPESTATETSADIGESEGKIRNTTRLEITLEEQRKIEEEAKEAAETAKEKVAAKQKKIAEAVTESITEKVAERVSAKPEEIHDHIRPTVEKLISEKISDSQSQSVDPEELVDKAQAITDSTGITEKETDKSKKTETPRKSEEISSEDLTDLKSAILSLGKKSSDISEELEVLELKKELQEYEEDLQDLKFIKAEAGRFDLQESKGAKRLFRMVNRMLGKVDTLVTGLEQQERDLSAKIKNKEVETSKEEEENLVSIHELIEVVQKLRKTSDFSKVEQIANVLSRMDEDADGIIRVDHVMKVIELLGREHIKMSNREVDQIIDMLAREEMMEVETMIEEVLGKSANEEELIEAGLKIQSSDEDLGNEAVIATPKEEVLKDVAQDITGQSPEPHIREMFDNDSNEPKDKGDEKSKASVKADKRKNDPMNLK